MRPYGNFLGCSPSKALLVFASLVLLCVSDGIGPRLLPYPSSEAEGFSRVPGTALCGAATDGTSAPSVESDALVGHADKAVTPIWGGSSSGKIAVSPPQGDQPPPDFYAPPDYSFSLASSPQGRAPPRPH